jgi:hypothetical protein
LISRLSNWDLRKSVKLTRNAQTVDVQTRLGLLACDCNVFMSLAVVHDKWGSR